VSIAIDELAGVIDKETSCGSRPPDPGTPLHPVRPVKIRHDRTKALQICFTILVLPPFWTIKKPPEIKLWRPG
jgi:hypothetical protein